MAHGYMIHHKMNRLAKLTRSLIKPNLALAPLWGVLLLGCYPNQKENLEKSTSEIQTIEIAVKTLAHSDTFSCDRWTGVGYDLENPAFRSLIVILKGPSPASDLKRVFDSGSSAAKLYSICGLYFCSKQLFDKALNDIAAHPIAGEVLFCDADLVYKLSAMEILKTPEKESVRLLYGESLQDYVARTAKFGSLDIAGGGIPVRLLDESWIEFRNAKDFMTSNDDDIRNRTSFIEARERFYSLWMSAIKKTDTVQEK